MHVWGWGYIGNLYLPLNLGVNLKLLQKNSLKAECMYQKDLKINNLKLSLDCKIVGEYFSTFLYFSVFYNKYVLLILKI